MDPVTLSLGAVGVGGSLLGGLLGNSSLDRAKAAMEANTQNANAQLRSGMSEARTGYQPFINAGTSGLADWQRAMENRTQAALPTLSNTSVSDVSKYLDPSAAYTMEQANKALEASAIAKGGLGGGFAKALSNNAQKMAQTNWNNAYNQMLQTNQQNFGQQQQNYSNQTDYDQSQIQNYGNLANMGYGSTNALQSLLGNYNTAISNNYTGLGKTLADLGADQGSNWLNMGNSIGKSLLGAVGFGTGSIKGAGG